MEDATQDQIESLYDQQCAINLYSKGINILVINYFKLEFMGGGETLSIGLFNYLAKHNVIKYISPVNINQIDRISTNEVKSKIKFEYEKVPFTSPHLSKISRPYPSKNIFSNYNIILYFLDRPPSKQLLRLLKFSNVPTVFLLHGLTIEKLNKGNLFISLYTYFINKIAKNRIVSLNTKNIYLQLLNENTLRSYMKNSGLDKRIFQIDNGIDFTKYQIKNPERFTVIWIGRIENRTKGIMLLMSIIKKFNMLIKEKQMDLKPEFVIIGSGRKSKRLLKMSSTITNLKYLGYVSEAEKLRLLSTSSIMLITSKIDPFPIVALEGIASGLYLLSTQVSGPSEIINKNKLLGQIFPFEPNTFASRIYDIYMKWINDRDNFYYEKIIRKEVGSQLFPELQMYRNYSKMIVEVLKMSGYYHEIG